MRVLVLEDEEEIREFLVTQLNDHEMETRGLPSSEGLQKELAEFNPELIVLDQMMPGKSGKEVVKELRKDEKFFKIPIVMVTGLNSEDDKVAALEIGADDYVTKPFSIKELVARIHALYRRAQASTTSPQSHLKHLDMNIDLKAHRIFLAEKEIQLTLTEFRILSELVRTPGQVLSRDILREKALGNLNVTDRTIDVHLASLRKKLEHRGDTIETVRGVGYRMGLG